MSPRRPPQPAAQTAPATPAAAVSAAQGREVSRKKEEEGRLPPHGKRRKAAQSQDAALERPDRPQGPEREEALDPKDAQKVPEHREPGPADPAARGRDAPVDVR